MRNYKQLVRAMERAKIKLAKVRDEMREIVNEAESIEALSADAFESLEYAIERLSEQV